MEYLISILDKPLFYVRGNHAKVMEYGEAGPRSGPHGGFDLHQEVVNQDSLLLAGVEGSLRYRHGPFQYTQAGMWRHVLALTPGLLQNRLLYGRYLDIFVTHAAPWGIHDQDDLPHQGIKAFRWLDRVFRPRFHFHGHIHVYRPDEVTQTQFGATQVINTFGYRVTEIDLPKNRFGIRLRRATG
jgi:Icc-related predicted phosphoesterase